VIIIDIYLVLDMKTEEIFCYQLMDIILGDEFIEFFLARFRD
jgi:hypothetical protein